VIKELFLKECDHNKKIVFAFLGLALMLLLVIHYLYVPLTGNSGIGWSLVWLIHGVGLPILFTFFIAANLIAVENGNGNLDALRALPVSPTVIWLGKYIFGLVLVVLFARGMVFLSLPAHPFHGPFAPMSYFAILWAIYSCSFFASGLAKNGLAGVLFSFLISSAVAGLGIVFFIIGAFVWTGTVFFIIPEEIVNFTYPGYNSIHFFMVNAVRVIPAVLALIMTIKSFLLFRWDNRRMVWRVRATLLLPLILVLGLLYWFAALCFANHPGQFNFTPRIDTSSVYDMSQRAEYLRFCEMSRDWEERLKHRTERVNVTIWWRTRDGDIPDTIAQLVAEKRIVCNEALEYLLTNEIQASIDKEGGMADGDPRLLNLLTVFRLEAIDAVRLSQNGDCTQAEKKLERMLRVLEKLSGKGSVLYEMVRYGIFDTIYYTVQQLYPLDSVLTSSTAVRDTLELLYANEISLENGLKRGLLFEAAAVENLIAMMTENLAKYPLTNPEMPRQSIHDEFQRLIDMNQADYWMIKDGIKDDPRTRAYYSSPDHRFLHPVDALIIDMTLPRLANVITRKTEAVAWLRLMQIQTGAYWYRRERGRLPDSLNELVEFLVEKGVDSRECIINPFDGSRYPYPDIISGNQVNLEYGDRQQTLAAGSAE